VSSEQNQYDVVVVGAGIGGYVAAIRAAQLGGRVAIIEKQYVGGTCLNVGCIPSKALLHIAQIYAQFAELEKMGIHVPEPPTLDIRAAVAYKDRVVKQLTGGVRQLLKANGIALFEGTGSVPEPGRIHVQTAEGQRELRADKTILATGSVPIRPPFPGIEGRNVIFSDDAMDMPRMPQTLVCIGGGVIAVELACMFQAFGTQVTIVEMLPAIIPQEDEEAGQALARSLTRRGVRIHTDARVERIDDTDNGLKRVSAATEQGSQSFEGEYVLVAVGRQANPAGLDGLIQQGLAMERSRVQADERMETNLPGVYAIGDLVGRTWLAHVAETEGEVAAENAMGHEASMDYGTVPRVIFTFPEVAAVGLTETEARKRPEQISAEKFPWVANGKALASGETEGFTKVVLGPYGEILGATIFGPDATNLITEFSLAMRAELTADEVIGTIHPHPTYSEALREATLAAEHRAIHIFQRQAASRQ
jgi:dihydrolipoamide dehydrogenase